MHLASDTAQPRANTLPKPSRRSLIGASLSALLAGAAIATAARGASTTDADAELRALAADYAAALAEIRRMEAQRGYEDEAYEPLDDRRYHAVDRATELVAVTPAALRAKASIILGEASLRIGPAHEDLDMDDLLAHSLARDVLRGGAA